MTAHVISHHGPARKRGLRIALLGAVALAAIAGAGWLAVVAVDALFRDPPPYAPPVASETLVIQAPAVAPEEAAPATVAETRPITRRVRHSVPLDATPATVAPDGYEVLSAAELDAISQDRAVEP